MPAQFPLEFKKSFKAAPLPVLHFSSNKKSHQSNFKVSSRSATSSSHKIDFLCPFLLLFFIHEIFSALKKLLLLVLRTFLLLFLPFYAPGVHLFCFFMQFCFPFCCRFFFDFFVASFVAHIAPICVRHGWIMHLLLLCILGNFLWDFKFFG